MLRLLKALAPTLRCALRSRRDLVLESLALRQQLATLAAQYRPSLRPADRAFWVALRRLWSRWSQVLLIVRPDTVIRWHRAGFRLRWARLSRRTRPPGRPPLPQELRSLIRRMASENGWGAPRTHGELLRLGLDVSGRSVSRHVRSLGTWPKPSQKWKTFLENHRHAIAAMDLFTYVLFVIRHERRDLAWLGVTSKPTAAWVIQQLREGWPFDTAPRHLVFDRDAVFGTEVVSVVRSMGIDPVRTAFRCP